MKPSPSTAPPGRSLKQVSEELGIASESLRAWVKQEAIDRGEQEGLSSDEREELRALRREVKTLRLEREVLKKSRGLLREGEPDPVKCFRFIAAEQARRFTSPSRGATGALKIDRLQGRESTRSSVHRVQRAPP